MYNTLCLVHNVLSVHGALYVVSILFDTSNKRHFQTPDRVHGYLGVSYIATLPEILAFIDCFGVMCGITPKQSGVMGAQSFSICS